MARGGDAPNPENTKDASKAPDAGDAGHAAVYLVDLVKGEKIQVVEKGKDGKPKLLPLRLYRRWEPLREDGRGGKGAWVYDLTDPKGKFPKEATFLLPASFLSGEWVGSDKNWFYFYRGDENDDWRDDWKAVKVAEEKAATNRKHWFHLFQLSVTPGTYDYPVEDQKK
jgi:hypothetical protein